MTLQRRFETVQGPPPEDFDAYAVRARLEYMVLLDQGADESCMQSFFERNPCFVPGVRGVGAYSSAFPAHSLLISQPRLSGLRERRPDFMWLAVNSVACHPILIEIERPTKAVFISGGRPSAQFSQARHQLTQWKAWFSSPANVQGFIDEYGLTSYSHLIGRIDPKFVLLYGRRSEVAGDPELARERSHLLDERDEFLVSYDRISIDAALSNAITVRIKPNGRFEALAVLPTFALGPSDAERLLLVDGLDEVIEQTGSISADRRAFLRSRLSYWVKWAQDRENNPRMFAVTSHERE
jgi:hypothetical protein